MASLWNLESQKYILAKILFYHTNETILHIRHNFYG